MCFVAVCMSVCLCVIVSPYWAHLLACVLSYQATGILVDLFTLNFPAVSMVVSRPILSAAPTFLLLLQYLTLC